MRAEPYIYIYAIDFVAGCECEDFVLIMHLSAVHWYALCFVSHKSAANID